MDTETAFKHACLVGDLTTVKQLSHDGLRKHAVHMLRHACILGLFEIVKYIVDRFKVTRNEVRNCVLRWTCGHGHINIAQWLVDTFHLTKEEVCMGDDHKTVLMSIYDKLKCLKRQERRIARRYREYRQRPGMPVFQSQRIVLPTIQKWSINREIH